MVRVNTSLQNFAAGELSPKIRGRFDLELYYNGAEKIKNFISETQGPARFRTGTKYVLHTRLNNPAVLIPFQFNDEQAYVLEFTDQKLRIYKDEGILLESAKTITGATNANPVVVSSAGHGYSNGDEVFINSVGGMVELNGKSYLVKNVAAGTFEITDVDGNNIDGTGFGIYTSGGTAEKIVEVDSPYLTADLFQLKYTQSADTMYIVHPSYEPRKLTRTGATTFTLSTFARTSDPFTGADDYPRAVAFYESRLVYGGTNNNPQTLWFSRAPDDFGAARYDDFTTLDKTSVTFDHTTDKVIAIEHGFSDGEEIKFEEGNTLPTGISEFKRYYVANATVNDFQIETSSTTTVVNFTDNGTPANYVYLSEFSILPDHAIINTIASKEPTVIRWLIGTDRILVAGTFGGEFRISGSRDDEIITPESINVRPVSYLGVADQMPATKEQIVLYTERGKRTIRAFQEGVISGKYESIDKNLIADHMTEGEVKQLQYQASRPDILWAVKENGELIGLTFNVVEEVSGWHRHEPEGDDEFTSICVLPREDTFDQLWLCVKRIVNGNTRYYVEFLSDDIIFPEPFDFFTDNQTLDTRYFRNQMFELQKEYIYTDSSLTYDGTDTGTAASATMTPGAVTGTGITFTASNPVFTATDVGREIWKKSIDGSQEGRAEITGFISTTIVTCKIKKDFDSTDVMAAGDWYLTADTIAGLDHLEGREVAITADGGAHPTETVTDGAISLDYQVSKAHIGLQYKGFIKTMNLEGGGINGPSQTKTKNLTEIGIRFKETLGAKFGTSLYSLDALPFRTTADYTNRPPTLFSGDKKVPYSDNWDIEKFLYIVQDKPLPCTVQLLVPYLTTSND
jgi:hypothetical protein